MRRKKPFKPPTKRERHHYMHIEAHEKFERSKTWADSNIEQSQQGLHCCFAHERCIGKKRYVELQKHPWHGKGDRPNLKRRDCIAMDEPLQEILK